MLVVVVLGAVQMFVLALMGEYIGRLYNEAKGRPLYIVQEVAGEAAPHARLGHLAHADQAPVAAVPSRARLKRP
jgi:dolichol-phosphate mannosyltransferase